MFRNDSPERFRLLIRLKPLRSIPAKVGGIQAGRVQFVDLSQQLPGPRDGLLLEVVPKRPVAQHLKEGVVVHVLAHIV